MTLGKDFFLWFKFIVTVIKMFIQIFGDDKENGELKKNGIGP